MTTKKQLKVELVMERQENLKLKSLLKRDISEHWFDKHNHKMEFLRTVFGCIGALTGLLVFLKVFEII